MEISLIYCMYFFVQVLPTRYAIRIGVDGLKLNTIRDRYTVYS